MGICNIARCELLVFREGNSNLVVMKISKSNGGINWLGFAGLPWKDVHILVKRLGLAAVSGRFEPVGTNFTFGSCGYGGTCLIEDWCRR